MRAFWERQECTSASDIQRILQSIFCASGMRSGILPLPKACDCNAPFSFPFRPVHLVDHIGMKHETEAGWFLVVA
jgi:hypothetical protein